MNNFIFENTTKVYFGQGGVKEYLESLLANYGSNVLLAYGGGSIKRNGVYAEVTDILHRAGKNVVEFSGIMSNPTYAKVQEGAKLAKENHVDLILAVGGGSSPTAARSFPRRPCWARTCGSLSTPSMTAPRSSSRWAPSSRCSALAPR